MTTKPKGLTKIWREVKKPFRQMFRFQVYNRSMPNKGIKYIGNDEYGLISVDARKEEEIFEYPDMIITNQSIGRYFIRDAKKIVNLGSGVGTFEHYNAVEHPDTLFVASEFDSSSVEYCNEHRPIRNVVFCSDNIETLCKTYGTFDFAVCVDVIEHIKYYGDFLREFVKLADRAVIATPNRDRYHRIAELQSPPYKQHTHEFNAGELYFLLRAFYKNVELYAFPDPYKQELTSIGIYSSYSKLVAHCNN